MSSRVIVEVQQRLFGSPTRKAVAAALADHASPDGTRIFPAPATVAAMAELSIKTVRREIGALVKMEILRLVKRGGRGRRSTNEYAFNMDRLRALPDYRDKLDADDREDVPAPDESLDPPAGAPVENPVDNPHGDNALVGHGDHLSEGVKVVTDGPLGGHSDHQTCKEPIPPISPATAGDLDRMEFEQFEERWPWYSEEHRGRARKAWADLDEIDRRGAVDYVETYLKAQRAGRTRSKRRLQAANYLTSEMWKNRKPAIQTVRRRIFVMAGTRTWQWLRFQRGRMPNSYELNVSALGRRERGWLFERSLFDGLKLPDDVSSAEGVEWCYEDQSVTVEPEGAA